MPSIKIWERDDTGVAYDGSETVVFVLGNTQVTSKTLDDNGCLYIAAQAGDNVTVNIPTELKGDQYIIKLVESGLNILYYYVDDIKPSKVLNLDFLKDKNMYNIKFLTAGSNLMFQEFGDSSDDQDILPLGNDSTSKILFDCLTSLAAARGDCCVIGSIGITKKPNTYLDDSSEDDSSTQINYNATIPEIKTWIDLLPENDSYKYSALFASKVVKNDITTYPDLAYLTAFGNAIKNKNTWEALANTARGSVSFNQNATISKYDLDTLVMNVAGRSFNGLIKLYPQITPVLWGDRTFINNNMTSSDGESFLNLKATSFLSIRNMISDIAKRAYYSAVNYTFETNNEITWTNFKGKIVNLLDEMVADYKLANYKIIKIPTSNRAEIKCEIHIAPYGPVEDFDIGIILTPTNAEVTENA